MNTFDKIREIATRARDKIAFCAATGRKVELSKCEETCIKITTPER